MWILANENVPASVVGALQAHGHDVCWARKECPGDSDAEVLARANSGNRIVLTFDKDFGQLAFRSDLPAVSGIVLLRLRLASPGEIAGQIVAALDSRSDWPGHFSVIEPDRIRMTPLPTKQDS